MKSVDESKKFRVSVSARHLHLMQETVDILFGKGHEIKPEVPTKGQFLSTTRAAVVGPRKTFEDVAIMGPCRDFNQFELSITDARALGIPAVVRMSGDIEGTPGIRIVGPEGEVTLEKGAIVAKRHIHLNPVLAGELGVKDGDSVLLRVESLERSLIFDDTTARVGNNPNIRSVAHIDTDEGNAAGIRKESMGYIVKCID